MNIIKRYVALKRAARELLQDPGKVDLFLQRNQEMYQHLDSLPMLRQHDISKKDSEVIVSFLERIPNANAYLDRWYGVDPEEVLWVWPRDVPTRMRLTVLAEQVIVVSATQVEIPYERILLDDLGTPRYVVSSSGEPQLLYPSTQSA